MSARRFSAIEEEKLTPDQEALIQADLRKKVHNDVDFHHKIYYRFEKAYRLGKTANILLE